MRPYGKYASSLIGAIAFCLALTSADPSVAQTADTPNLSRYHGIADYWRTAAKSFEDGAAAATSETKKSVWTELADYFKRGTAHFEELAIADDKVIAAAKQRAASQAGTGSPAQRPLPVMPLRPVIPVTPAFPSATIPGPAQAQGSPLDAVFAQGDNCRREAFASADQDEDDYDRMLQRKRRYEECHVPELRAMADRDRAVAREIAASAEATPPAPSGQPACGWNCVGRWEANEADRKKELLKRKSELLTEIADHLASAADSNGAAAPSAASVGTTVSDGASGAFCPALKDLPGKTGGNDPYLLCDCLDEYLRGRLARYYGDMLKRSERYVWSPALLGAEFTVPGRFQSDFPMNFLFDIEAARPTAADRYACHLDLMEYEISRVRASWPREIEVGSGLIPTSPAESATHLKNLYQTVYRTARDRITALWESYYREATTGVMKITAEQGEFSWNQHYKSRGALKAIFDETIVPQQNAHADPIDATAYWTEAEALCGRDNNASYARIRTASGDMLAAVSPLRTGRLRLISELLEWEALAERDGWPQPPEQFSFKTVADQLWQTVWAGTRDKHYPEPTAVSIGVVGPYVGNHQYVSAARAADPSPAITPNERGFLVFFHEHQNCSLWNPSAERAGVYVMASGQPLSSQPLTVEPSIAQELTPFGRGPFSQQTQIRGNATISLVILLFEKGEREFEAYYSGAGAEQNP